MAVAAERLLSRLGRWVLGKRPELLGEVSFGRYWSAQTISLFGDQISSVALPLTAVLVLRASAAEMGYLTALLWLPSLLFGVHAGAWVDRRGHRRATMIVADLARFALLASVPTAYATGTLTLAQLYAVAFAAGLFSVLFNVADTTLFVALVRSDRYVEANSLIQGSRAMSFVGGPSLGGVLVQLLAAPFAIAADALSFLGSAALLGRTSAVEPPPAEGESVALSAGARFIARSAILRAGLCAAATVNFFTFAFGALFMLYAVRKLHVAPGVLGVVLGAGAIGGVLGAVACRRLADAIGVGRTCLLGFVVFPVPLLLVPLAGGAGTVVLAMLFIAEFASGLGVVILDISISSIFAVVTPNSLRARVTGAFQAINFGTRPLGAVAAGALGTLIGLRTTLWIAAAGATLSFLWLLPSPLLPFQIPDAATAGASTDPPAPDPVAIAAPPVRAPAIDAADHLPATDEDQERLSLGASSITSLRGREDRPELDLAPSCSERDAPRDPLSGGSGAPVRRPICRTCCATNSTVASVGIRELRQRASELVRRVEGGESIEITDRGRPVAVLAPLPEDPIERLRASGDLEAARGDWDELPEPLSIPAGAELPSRLLERLRRDER